MGATRDWVGDRPRPFTPQGDRFDQLHRVHGDDRDIGDLHADPGVAELNAALGLIVGGVIAAPFGGFVVSRIPILPLMLAVGALIIVTTLVRIL